jgi:lauroyl/myristoyl acyltransferase
MRDSYGCYKVAAILSKTLPRRASYALAALVSGCFYRIDSRARRGVALNIETILAARGRSVSPLELRRLTRRTFYNFGKYLVDFFRFVNVSPDELRRLVTIEHPEYIQQAMDMNRGVLAISAHLGNWEMGGAVLAQMGYPITAIATTQRMARVNRLLQDHRDRRGYRVLPLDASATLNILRCIQNHEMVALLADRDFTGHTVEVPFFGKPALLPRGPGYLCVRTQTPILPGFIIRKKDDTFLLRIYPPIVPNRDTDEKAVQLQLAAVLEDVVAEAPDQWLVFRDFWNGREEVPQA